GRPGRRWIRGSRHSWPQGIPSRRRFIASGFLAFADRDPGPGIPPRRARRRIVDGRRRVREDPGWTPGTGGDLPRGRPVVPPAIAALPARGEVHYIGAMSPPPPFDPALDALVTPVLRADRHGRVALCNQAFARWLGVSQKRLPDQPLVALEAEGDSLRQ